MSPETKPSLMHVVGPLVRLLGQSDLTWEDRARISDAIFETRRHWNEMKNEAAGLNQAQAAGAGLGASADERHRIWRSDKEVQEAADKAILAVRPGSVQYIPDRDVSDYLGKPVMNYRQEKAPWVTPAEAVKSARDAAGSNGWGST